MTRPSWFVAAALVGLGQHRANTEGEAFSASDLVGWVAAFERPGNALLAIKALVTHRYLEPLPLDRPQGVRRPVERWRLTPAGVIAAATALQSDQALPAKAYGPLASAETVDPFAARLWSLFRIRKALTADEASCSLTDAGEDLSKPRRRAGELLLAWSRQCPQAVKLSARRVDGCKRYVLMVDLGTMPPHLRKGGTRE